MKRSPIKRKKGLPRKNVKRAAKRFQEDFGGADYVAHIRSLPCALCGVEGYSEAAHVRSRGAGGKAADIVPLCGTRVWDAFGKRGRLGCHFLFDTHGNDARGQEARLKQYAAELWSAYQESQPVEPAYD